MSKLLEISEKSYYVWKKKTHTKLINLIEVNFSKEELDEYLKSGKISKFELLKEQELTSQYAANYYINIFLQRIGSIGDNTHESFLDLYFSVLVYSKNNIQEQTAFKPFSVQKSALLYLSKNDFQYEALDYEVIPSFEAGVELLDEFECYTNQFLQSCILQNFKPLIHVAKKDERMDDKEKIEAYLHALFFHVYSYHTDKTKEEKRTLLSQIILFMYESHSKKYIPSTDSIINKTEMSLNILLKKDLDLIQKEYDNIIKAIQNS